MLFLDLVFATHDALDSAGIEHAFGGALALMHHVNEPRTTWDIDLNVSVGVDDAERVLNAFEGIATYDATQLSHLIEDGQVRIFHGRYPIDIFLSVDKFHEDVRQSVVMRPFGNRMLPYISATHLSVMKAYFDRPKDWVDILEMMKASAVDIPKALGWLTLMTNEKDERPARFRAFSLANSFYESSEDQKSKVSKMLMEFQSEK